MKVEIQCKNCDGFFNMIRRNNYILSNRTKAFCPYCFKAKPTKKEKIIGRGVLK